MSSTAEDGEIEVRISEKPPPVHPTEIRTSISASSAVELKRLARSYAVRRRTVSDYTFGSSVAFVLRGIRQAQGSEFKFCRVQAQCQSIQFEKSPPVHPTEIRTSISPSSEVELNTTSARGSRYSHHSRPPSHYSYRSGKAPSEVSTVKTKTSRKGGVVVETMAAPNPFCPNTKGICCLMLLLNLGLILVTLGFVVVIQFFEPLIVWILGIVFLIFGFLTLIGSLVYCVHVCKDAKSPKDVHPEDLYWTHHWQKNIGSPEIHYKAEDKYPDDRYSDRYSVSKYSGKYSDKDHRSDRY
uniref:(California timema) hypothetical protein n=1 Tax=Timema californicum TaxID=61474 RepID=A0A7R9J3I4_TIMCA|nr:unnamed protein product [Timema californicum]